MITFSYAIALVFVLHFQHSLAIPRPACQNANWWRSFDRTGWSTCSNSAFPYITGFLRSRAPRHTQDYIYHLEEARCCKGSNEFENQRAVCQIANWVQSFDRTNTWNSCPTGYFLNGLYRSAGQYLHNIENGKCCKPQGHPNRYQACYKENVWNHFNHNDHGMKSCSKPGYYITGIYRSSCDFLYCVEEFMCCSMTAPTQSCKSTTCLNGGKCNQRGSILYCTCPAGFSGTRCEKEAQATCSGTGDPHYRTFDGKTYNFMGVCQYVLAKDTGNNFEVLQKNEKCFNSDRVSCTNAVTVTVKSLKIHVGRGGRVTVFGLAVRLPYNNKGVNIVKHGGRTVRITTDIGLTVQYDGVYNVFVTVKSRYKGKTLGLCGNYNGNPNDEFVKKDKITAGNPNEFADSWKVDRSCLNPPLPPRHPCKDAGALALEAKKKCSLLKLAPFSLCHNTVNQNDGFIQDCEYDVCACKDNPVACLCEEYSAYATTCALKGITINWRQLPKFVNCATPCASAPCLNSGICSNHGNNYRCVCPTGFSGRQCETEGEATCSATGDPHYKTFDNRRYDFMGACQYVLVKDLEDKFEVLQTNVICNGRFSCANSVTATIKGLKVHVAKGCHVTVFGHSVNLPYTRNGVRIIKIGSIVKITTNIGLTVQYNGGSNVFVTVKGRYRGKTLGLCGNYNGNPNDDFIKQDKTTAHNPNEFSNSWKVDRSCPNLPPRPDPCKNAGALHVEAKKKCALLKLTPFSQCHNAVKQENGFIQNCEYDVCACRKHPLSCLCEEYAAYVTSCSIVGVVVKWKNLPAFRKCSSPCASGPCNNDGTCSNQGKGYKCTCSQGYTGLQCETRTCKNPKALGMESGQILDSQLTASSEWDVNHGPTNARLNFKPQGRRTGAWSSKRNDIRQWLQIDFKYRATVTEILTQGRKRHNQWVKTYTVSYSDDGVNFKPYRHGGLDKVFQGNTDRDTIVRQSISPVIVARYIRIHPKTWTGHISMRAEFIGCFEDEPCSAEPCRNGGTCKKVDAKRYTCACLPGYSGSECQEKDCKDPLVLGMENGEILDGQITASSQWDRNHGPGNARINFKPGGGKVGAWSAKSNNLQQWLQVDFELRATITEILTQGRYAHNQWVKTYAVTYSTDGVFFDAYQENGKIKILQGNRDRNSIVRQTLSPVIVTRYIRIHPRTWVNHISMRVDFVGCIKEWECEPNPCLNGATCVEHRNSYLCSCATGYAGRNCEKKQGDCSNNTV